MSQRHLQRMLDVLNLAQAPDDQFTAESMYHPACTAAILAIPDEWELDPEGSYDPEDFTAAPGLHATAPTVQHGSTLYALGWDHLMRHLWKFHTA